LLQRVEVITGGATTVYGSDAIAGFVNFMTRDDFDGFALEMSYYATEAGASDTIDVNLAWGHEFGRGNLSIFGGYLDREETFQSERRFSAQTINDNWFTSMLEPGGSLTTPAGTISFPQVDYGNGPALMARNNGSQANAGTEMCDVFGRAFTLRLALNF
jgi:iron complex outermembrane receptor protein